MYRYGHVDVRVLQDILGHANLGTTEIYTHTSSTQIEEAMNANPLAHEAPSKKPLSPQRNPLKKRIHKKHSAAKTALCFFFAFTLLFLFRRALFLQL